jgi:hypothetical protein
VLIEYNSLSHQGTVVMRALVGDALKPVGTFTVSELLLFLLINSARALEVSLLQEVRDIDCEVKDGDRTITKVHIDKKDYELSITDKQGVTRAYKQEKFLDRAILAVAESDPTDRILVQILPGAEGLLIKGAVIPFLEKNCEDTGASKTCKSDGIKELYWSPEELRVKTDKMKVKAPIVRYGFFANHGTFTYARENSKGRQGYPAVFLIDYGAKVEMVLGAASRLDCKYP